MPLIKPDAAQLEFLKARIAGLAALHREIAAMSEAADLPGLQRMAEIVDSRLRQLHPTVISEYEMVAFRGQVRGMVDVCLRMLAR